MQNTMRGIVIYQPGGPEVLQINDSYPTPKPLQGWILIRVRAFGINRSEHMTRLGYSGDAVPFPRILGIECVGEVVDNGGTDLQVGDKVCALMGGMGRKFDGGYAEFTLAPKSNVFPVKTSLSWEILASIPETFMTAWGSLFNALSIQKGDTILIRGATSSVGRAALSIAKHAGLIVLATTRTESKVSLLRTAGADHVIVDAFGAIAPIVRENFPNGINHVLELVGVTTLRDSIKCLALKGTVCLSGILAGEWIIREFEPLTFITSGRHFTVYSSDMVGKQADDRETLQKIVDGVEKGWYTPNIDRIFKFDEIVEAHTHMVSNKAAGKIIVLGA